MKIQYGRWLVGLVAAVNLAWIAVPAAAEQAGTSDDKVAVVNGSVITRAEFDRAMDRVQRSLANRGTSIDESELVLIKRDVVEGLINAELLYQETQRKGITVGEATINEELNALKERFPDEGVYQGALTKAQLSEADLRSQIKKGLAIQEFITKEFVENVTVSSGEVKAYYDSHPESFKQPEQVRASHILIKIDTEADDSQRAEARKKIETIQEKLREGEDFASLATELSEDPSSTRGGDLGYFTRGRTDKAFEDAAFSLQPGEVSEPVETQFGYHLIKLVDKKPEATIPYEDIKDRLEQYLKDEKTQEEVNQYVQGLKENAKVERFLAETKQ